MKNPILSAAFTLLAAAPALAGSPEALVYQAPEVVAAAQTDWSGFYAGGLVSFDSAGIGQSYNGGALTGTFQLGNNTSYGGFTGYRFQSGAMVYGGEVAVSSGGLTVINQPAQSFGPIYDLKAHVGYSFNDFLIYGIVGQSSSTLANSGAIPFKYPSHGFAYGVGVDYLVTENLFVGFEYLTRDLSGTHNIVPAFSIHTTIQSAQLRVGWKF